MSDEPTGDPGGRTSLESSDVHSFFPDLPPGPSRSHVAYQTIPQPQYMVADDNIWIQPLQDVVYEDAYTEYQEAHSAGQQSGQMEEVYFLTDEERDVELMRNSIGGLHVGAHEVVVDEMMGKSSEPQQYIHRTPASSSRIYSQQFVQGVPRHALRQAHSQQIVAAPGHGRVRYVVQQGPATGEIPSSRQVQYEMRPMAMFEGPSNQSEIPQQHHSSAPLRSILRSRSKSQPRRPLLGDLEDDSLAFLVQEHDESEWDGVEMEDHEYFVGNEVERQAVLNTEDDDQGLSSTQPPKTIQRR
ncbi:unnamed protein product [Nippostrongylus brasiliensis]|uniref:Anaphase-promoting complex subunit 13 n=1 Tax=Nippostrongylus brasiliensis TaxID=27835 RepID=A0A158R3P5_NIPBR|nr:unnamed protein product [Nippostrongylus brasiliensis]